MINTIKQKIARRFQRCTTMLEQRNKNPFSLLWNVLRLQRTRGFYFTEIHDNELDIRDKEYEQSFLNWEEQKHYLTLLNPREYSRLARNKYLAHITLDNLGIKEKSQLLCYYHPEIGVATDIIATSVKDVMKILKQKGVSEFVAKTTESSHGDNVWVFKGIRYEANEAMLTRFDGEEMPLSSILGKEPIVFETVIKQSKQMSEFNPSSVNTIRFMTMLLPGGEAKIFATFTKIGRAGRCVDNAGAGGNVDSKIDVATGRLTDPILFKGWRDIDKIEKHPDSGAQLKDVAIKDWENIKAKVIEFQQRLPFVKAAGWDIAITEEGPVIIEVNDMWDRTGQLFLGHGWKREIIDCYNAWKNYYSDSNFASF